ncbi:MAG: hypothetical protein LBI62_00965 [Candidatus Accumulibacter sp.]|jgi:hypothetical protein|nr:hypothetical protein [Accumulibacter sp.]
MSSGAWSCPHERNGCCGKFKESACDPGMKGCELYGRYVFFDAGKNARLEQKKARETLRDESREREGSASGLVHQKSR